MYREHCYLFHVKDEWGDEWQERQHGEDANDARERLLWRLMDTLGDITYCKLVRKVR